MSADARATAGVAALAALALVLHVHFAVIDARPAVDLGHVWSGAIRAARDGAPADTPYAAIAAALWRAFGRTSAVLDALDGLWTVALVAGLGLAGHRAGSATGAIVAAAAGVLFPLFPTSARTHWIHLPEAGAAALALGLAAAPAVGRDLARALALGAIAGLAATARPSAAVWMLVPLALWSWRAWSARAVPLLIAAWVPFLVGVIAIAPSLPGYLALRFAVREGTMAAVGPQLRLLPIQTGPLPGLLYVLLAAGGVWQVARAGPAGRPPPREGARRALAIAAIAWILAGLGVVFASGAGPDNVPVVFVGLAVLAAAGAADLPSRPVLAVTALLLAIGPGTQLWPRLGVAGAVTGWRTADEPLNWLVPNPLGFSEGDLRRGIEAACPPAPARCRLVVERGLTHPSWEDDGQLALFLAGLDRVDPVTAQAWDGRGADAAVEIACRGPAPDPTARFPGTQERFDAAIARMRPVEERIGNGCARRWYAPAARR